MLLLDSIPPLPEIPFQDLDSRREPPSCLWFPPVLDDLFTFLAATVSIAAFSTQTASETLI